MKNSDYGGAYELFRSRAGRRAASPGSVSGGGLSESVSRLVSRQRLCLSLLSRSVSLSMCSYVSICLCCCAVRPSAVHSGGSLAARRPCHAFSIAAQPGRFIGPLGDRRRGRRERGRPSSHATAAAADCSNRSPETGWPLAAAGRAGQVICWCLRYLPING